MKRITLFIALVVIAVTSMAQDIIVTRSQTRIEGNVLEISDTEVKYNKREAPNGPSLVLPTSEIDTIIFANGEVYSFQNGTIDAPEWVDTNYEEYPIVIHATGKSIQFRTGTHIEQNNGNLYYGNTLLSQDDYAGLLNELCPDAYNVYKKGNRLGKISTALSVVGVGLCVYAFYEVIQVTKTIMQYDSPDPNPVLDARLEKHGIRMCVSEVLGIVTLIPTKKISKREKELKAEALRIFNQECAWSPIKKPQPELSFNISLNSVGVSLRF